MPFLPAGYQAPRSSNNFMKLQDGENKIRILSTPILGWEDWIDQKPIRYRMDERPAQSHDPKKPLKHFWSFIVFNYKDEAIQILHVTQASIRSALEALCNDKDWGMPYLYDIKINKSGQKMDTEYTVNPTPHKKIADYIIEQFNEKPCCLDVIFENGDPFAPGCGKVTPGMFDNQPKIKCIPEEDAFALDELLHDCGEDYRLKVMAFLSKNYNISKLQELTLEIYEQILASAQQKMKTISTNNELAEIL